MCARFMHSNAGPKNIAFCIDGKWIDVTCETAFNDDSDTWFMYWDLPELDEYEMSRVFQISYSIEEGNNEVEYYLDDEVYELEDVDRQRIRDHIRTVAVAYKTC